MPTATELEHFKERNREGFVLYYRSGFMEKVKFDEYCKLHKAIYGLNARAIWELGSDYTMLHNLIQTLPQQELKDWAFNTWVGIANKVEVLMDDAYDSFKRIGKTESRKEFAFKAKAFEDIAPLLFLIYDNKAIYQQCWKLCKPKHETPFRPAASDEE